MSDTSPVPYGEKVVETDVSSTDSDFDFYAYHERTDGRLVIDPEEARIEFGDKIASKLKLSKDGTKVLWPQPTDNPEDPQNWSSGRKTLQLIIVTLTAIVPDFNSGIGIPDIFALAKQYHTTTDEINDLTSNWSIFLIGWGGIFAVMLMRRYGRLPVIFWSQLIALAFLIALTFAPTLKVFTAMRCLTAFFGTAPQVTGLYAIMDMYPFHLQARKLNVWTMGFIISPFLSPFVFGFLVARASWRWTYGVGCIYMALVVLMIAVLGEETLYDRTVKPIPKRLSTGLRYRVETLVGITGVRMAKYRPPWSEIVPACFHLIWRPHFLAILVFEGMLFGFTIGITVTNALFLGMPKPAGYGFSTNAISGIYATPMVAVLIGEVVGRFLNEWIQNVCIRRNNGVFEAESRLWASYVAVPLYVTGFVIIGASIQNHFTIGALIMGWGIAQVAAMLNTVAAYAYCNDCFPRHQGEVSALVNLARTLGGFAVAYFQVPWAMKNGAVQTFGCEGAVVAGLFLLIVPVVQWKGRQLRERFSY
ncbi:MFS general substrate transporter [Dentipellis sp. KUC8613]|nr:MFS general substrate transporter [Dentipellis sp. KUC8613]